MSFADECEHFLIGMLAAETAGTQPRGETARCAGLMLAMVLSVAAGVRAASAARALMKGLSGRLSRRLLPGIGRLLGVGVGAGVWLLLDSLVLFADEYFTREQFQEELTSLVDEQRAGLRVDLSARVDEVRMTTLGPVTPAALEGVD